MMNRQPGEIPDFDKHFPPGFFLETPRVLLQPMEKDDLEKFLAISQSDSLWKYFTRELNDENQLRLWVNDAIEDKSASKRMPFTVIEKETGCVCGSTSFGNISFFDKRIEIGWSWVGKQYLGSGINRHCKYALLKYAFETMQFERVEIKTDVLNSRARQALRNIGATEEGVLRSHMQMPHGRRRDSVFYSILRNEWEQVKTNSFGSEFTKL